MRELAAAVDDLSELRSCPMKPDPYGIAGAAENGCDLSVVQPFPCHECEQFPVGVGQASEGCADSGEFRGGLRIALHACQLGAQPITQARAPSFTPVVVGQHTACNPVEPEPG